MIVNVTIDQNTPLTEEQKQELIASREREIVFDEDCPPSTESDLKKFERVNPIKRSGIAML